jgi:hypothetical protein
VEETVVLDRSSGSYANAYAYAVLFIGIALEAFYIHLVRSFGGVIALCPKWANLSSEA